jgi:hypothetical protein
MFLVGPEGANVYGILYRSGGVLMFIDEASSWAECITDYGDIFPRGEGKRVEIERDRFAWPPNG